MQSLRMFERWFTQCVENKLVVRVTFRNCTWPLARVGVVELPHEGGEPALADLDAGGPAEAVEVDLVDAPDDGAVPFRPLDDDVPIAALGAAEVAPPDPAPSPDAHVSSSSSSSTESSSSSSDSSSDSDVPEGDVPLEHLSFIMLTEMPTPKQRVKRPLEDCIHEDGGGEGDNGDDAEGNDVDAEPSTSDLLLDGAAGDESVEKIIELETERESVVDKIERRRGVELLSRADADRAGIRHATETLGDKVGHVLSDDEEFLQDAPIAHGLAADTAAAAPVDVAIAAHAELRALGIANAIAGIELLINRTVALAACGGGVNVVGNLSIIQHTQSTTSVTDACEVVSYATWGMPQGLWGQLVRLELGAAVWPTSTWYPHRNLRGCTIVHPDIGVKVVQSRILRMPVPEQMQNLKLMWELALAARDPTRVGLAFTPCRMCGSCAAKSPHDLVMRCALCLLPGHRSCTTDLATTLQDGELPHVPPPTAEAV